MNIWISFCRPALEFELGPALQLVAVLGGAGLTGIQVSLSAIKTKEEPTTSRPLQMSALGQNAAIRT